MGALVVCVCAFQVQGLEHELHVCSETGRGAANSNPALVSDGNPDLAGWTFAPRAMLDYYVLLATHVGPYRDFFFLIWDPCWGRTGGLQSNAMAGGGAAQAFAQALVHGMWH